MYDSKTALRAASLTAALLICLTRPILAAEPDASSGGVADASIAGRVIDDDGAPVPGAEVRISGTARRIVSAADGGFHFDSLAPGRVLLEVESAFAGRGLASVDLLAGATAQVEVRVDLRVHAEEISVTASLEPRPVDEQIAPVTVLGERELLARSRPTLGQTLDAEAGVNQTFFGPGASRPILRGVGGDRIRVLRSGLGTGDASTTSPDHAVTLDPLSTDRIEIVRGPATLLYGSNAVGGVVDVADRTVPDARAEEPLSGSVTFQAGSNSDALAGSVDLSGGADNFAWHAGAYDRDDDDYESGDGVVPNSFVEGSGVEAGISWVTEGGYLGVGGGRFESRYGNAGEPDEKVFIDMESDRWELSGGLDRPFGIFRGAKIRLGGSDYEHREIEGGETGTTFLNEAFEGRFELPHRALGPLEGSFGASFSSRDFSALGDEAFVPPTSTDNAALFLLEHFGDENLRFEVGARYEHQKNRADAFPGSDEPGPRDRSFSGVSGSFGMLWNPGETFGLAVSISRSTKLPNAEELYSNGPHIATGAFEIGDPDLDPETSLGADLVLRKRTGRLTGSLMFFYNRFDDYIFENFTDEFAEEEEGEEDGGEEGEEAEEPLRIVRIEQRDATFRGAELDAHIELLHDHPHHLELEIRADVVRAEDRTTDDPLPRIPPLRYGLGLRYAGERWQGDIGWRRVEAQDRVTEFETTTPGYDTFNASVGYRFLAGRTVHDIVLTGTNLTDELAYNHVSFLKEVAPLPGRDLRLTYRLSF